MHCIGLGHAILLLVVWFFVSYHFGISGMKYKAAQAAIIAWWAAGLLGLIGC